MIIGSVNQKGGLRCHTKLITKNIVRGKVSNLF